MKRRCASHLYSLHAIDSVMRMEKKNYQQVNLEVCKYKMKKIKMPEFMDVELESNSNSDS